MIDLAIMCLTMNVYWEARNQSIAGQVAVAQVTMNRVHSPEYPNDVCSVVHQNNQFSWYWDEKSDIPKEEAAWEQAQIVAEGAFAGSGHSDLEGVMHYHAIHVKPYWTKEMQLVARIDDHAFYIE